MTSRNLIQQQWTNDMIVAGSSAAASSFHSPHNYDIEDELRMKKLSVLFAITILVVGLGFYRGWFALSRSAPTRGTTRLASPSTPTRTK